MSEGKTAGKVEAVARAMFAARCAYFGEPIAEPSKDDRMGYFLNQARAAIAAMREPSMRMNEAGEISGDWRCDSDGDKMDGNPDEVWRSMIDAALKEG